MTVCQANSYARPATVKGAESRAYSAGSWIASVSRTAWSANRFRARRRALLPRSSQAIYSKALRSADSHCSQGSECRGKGGCLAPALPHHSEPASVPMGSARAMCKADSGTTPVPKVTKTPKRASSLARFHESKGHTAKAAQAMVCSDCISASEI